MDPSSLHPSVNQAATLSFSFGGVGHLERIPVPRSSSLGQLGGLFGDGQSAPLHCRSENHWGDGQVHTSRVPHRRPGFVHWHWALSASNFHRGLNWETEPVRISRQSVTTEHEFAQSSGEAGSPWFRAGGKNSAAIAADAMPADEAQLRELFKQLEIFNELMMFLACVWKCR